MLTGLMMDYPLTVTHLLERARAYFPESEIVSRRQDGSLSRLRYADFHRRTCRLANALRQLGVEPGDRVATLSWNHHAHLEAYFAVPTIGAVLHTLNLRLHPTELGYIANHAKDKVVIVDRSLLPLLEKFERSIVPLEHVIVFSDDGSTSHGRLDYETLLAAEPDTFDFPTLDEKSAAAMCYTSGTTGHPKGVLYSHRSTVLHALAACTTDSLGVSEADSVLPVVPMFHAMAWGLPYSAVMSGAKMVMPGPHLDPKSLLELMAGERTTLAAGVPTIWLGLLAMLDREKGRWDLSSTRTFIVGGSAAPASMIEGYRDRHGIDVTHAWGMTETSPLGTVARLKRDMATLDPKARLAVKSTQGYAAPFVETRHVTDEGKVLPWDGKTMGELEVRGPWVASAYYDSADQSDRFTKDGWFKTGDVVTIDAGGYVRITDRSKDVIKSGGEWISTVDLENAIMSHPSVLEAAVFAGRHPKCDERPIAAVVLKEGTAASKEEIEEHLRGKFEKWWLPDLYLIVKEIPRTSTGKFLKSKLRELYGELLMPEPRASR